MGKISQALNSRPKGALPSDTVVNPKGRNNTGHAMAVTTRSGRGGNSPTSSQKQLVDDEQVVQEEEVPKNVVQSSDEVRIDIDDSVELTQEESKAPLPKPPPPYLQRLSKKNDENQFKKFIQMMKSLSINVPLVEALKKMPAYAKFMKDLVTKKWSMSFETIKVTRQVSAIVHSMAPKLEYPGAFTIPCTIGSAEFAKALCDLGANCKVDYEVPIILERPFLAMGKALCDVKAGELTFQVGDETLVFHLCKSMRKSNSNEVCSFVDLVTDVMVDSTLAVLQTRKKAIGWTLEDIRGINPAFYIHKINLEEGAKTSI
ncbi:uncharacterized protein [Nicotiana tomentosiformis]|uniref:uncharacterized protein n=1 Tax=Nicotiana tomentosiformis TaxID=4098 RepID=UPI00388C5396